MGQYFHPCALITNPHTEKVEPLHWLYTWDYENGLKLMEHSYLTNGFMNTVESLLAPGGMWHKMPIVWAGDYADKEEGTDYNLNSLCIDRNKIKPAKPKNMMKRFRYIVNHDTKQYVDKRNVPLDSTHEWKGKTYKNYLHPLSILTCEGNGQGGGDLHLESPLIGSWARNHISVESTKPKGYTELVFNLTEAGPVSSLGVNLFSVTFVSTKQQHG